MNVHRLKPIRLILLVGLIILSACQAPTPQATPTIDAGAVAQTVSVIQTNAVQTAIAQITLDAALHPSATPTPQPPTSTPIPPTLAPTATFPPPPPPPTATYIPVTQAPTITSTPADYQCSIISASPANGTEFAKNADFDGKWTLENTGIKLWDASITDFRYISGEKFQKHGNAVDLPNNLAKTAQVSLIVDMHTPSTSGTYTTTWALAFGSTTFCNVTLSIVVK